MVDALALGQPGFASCVKTDQYGMAKTLWLRYAASFRRKLDMRMLVKAYVRVVIAREQQQLFRTYVQGSQQCPTCQMLKVGGSSRSLAGIISMVLSTESSGSSQAAAAM
jgi:hypothetical protein